MTVRSYFYIFVKISILMAQFHTLTVSDIQRETTDCVSVAFEVPNAAHDQFAFQAGQYLTLRTTLDGEEVRRSYSICSAPQEDELRVAIKKVESGRFSTFANEVLQVGDTLESMSPMGNFVLPQKARNTHQYVAFAAGSGITPVISIIKSTLAAENDSHFTLFYGNRGVDSIIFRDELDALKNLYLGRLSIHHVFSQERLDAPLFNGRIDAEKCPQLLANLLQAENIAEWFICGPEPMIFAVKETLEQVGVPAEKVHFELFTSPVGSLAKSEEKKEQTFDPSLESQVTIQLDGTAFDFNLAYSGDNVLDAALKQGADLPFACKGGVCSTCRAKLVEGEVDMDANFALEPDELAANFILTCQSHPRTPKIVVDFDQQ